jgi:hypothetical protein
MTAISAEVRGVWAAVFALTAGISACQTDTPVDPPGASDCAAEANGCIPPDERPSEPGTAVKLSLSQSDQDALAKLDEQVVPLASATAESLLEAHPVPFANELDYDPMAAVGLDLIQASGLALAENELTTLGEQGFVISPDKRFPNMAFGLHTIYAHDLPVYISIDPILNSVHVAYEAILKSIESGVLSRDLEAVLDGARKRNAEHAAAAEVRKDLDFYFTVALSLLRGQAVKPIAGADASLVATFLKHAAAASGNEEVELFGVPRQLDFSQFTPRGHYVDSPELTRYFQAMMWLGRTDFRLIETQPDGSQVFHRRQLNSVLALRDAVADVKTQFERIDAIVTAFVGQHDYMQLREVDALLGDLGVSSADELDAVSDETIAQTIIDRGYGAQRIMSQVIFKAVGTAGTLPLDRSFAFLGQRYVVDSHVFSEVTYDRVLPGPSTEARYMPDPLDAAYAALGNDAALQLLRDDLDKHGYAPQLERVRLLIDAYDADFWQENLYNGWLSALQALSPTAAQLEQLPSVARSERWSRRVLSTQLASWAQLRHDTILYAKQSYTTGNACEFPDAYVDPYPEAFARLAQFAEQGKRIGALLGDNESTPGVHTITSYFDELFSVANILRDMAEQQQKGIPFNEAQMAFVNDAVKAKGGTCGGPTNFTGWYARLLLGKDDGGMEPTIADVHTDPGGTRPAHVLHVATGLPRLIVLTVNSCNGPRAYAGVSYSFHEVMTDGLVRLNDQEWETKAPGAADVPWMDPLLGR